MKKLIITALLAAVAMVLFPVSVKADAALDYANTFKDMQINNYKAQVDYYNNYQVPVMQAYDAAMTNQISQALAAQYQSQLMAAQADARFATNMYQIGTNANVHADNIRTQLFNMWNSAGYNTTMTGMNAFYNTAESGVSAVSWMMGQPLFPQVQ